VKSLVAQVYEGLPETVEKSEGTTTGGEMGVKLGKIIPVEFESKGSFLYSTDSRENKTLHNYIYNILENKLRDLGKIKIVSEDTYPSGWGRDDFADGELVLIEGYVQIYDFNSIIKRVETFPEIYKIIRKFSIHSLKQKLQNGEIEQREYEKMKKETEKTEVSDRDTKDLAIALKDFYSGIIKIKIYPSRKDTLFHFIGYPIGRFFEVAAEDLLNVYGIQSSAKWVLLGIVNRPEESDLIVPALPSTDKLALDTAVENLLFIMSDMQKTANPIQFPIISIIPLAVYRSS